MKGLPVKATRTLSIPLPSASVGATFGATGPGPGDPSEQILVVNAEGMDADTLYHHLPVRHPELCSGDKHPRPVAAPAELRGHHRQAHDLIPRILNHYHEADSSTAI